MTRSFDACPCRSPGTRLRLLASMAALLLCGSAQALKNNYCEAEMAARAAEKLTPQQADELDRYQGFNISMEERVDIMREMVTAHLAISGRQNMGWKPDGTAVAACLIKAIAEGNREARIAPYALEAYGLMLMSGQGVKADKTQGMLYLKRAAQWNYASASMHLARIHLAEKAKPESRLAAIEWLERAVYFNEVPGYSASPAEAPAMLFGFYLPKAGEPNYEAAESLYRRLRGDRSYAGLLTLTLPKIPGLADKLEAERQAAIEAQRRADEYSRCMKDNTNRYGGGSGNYTCR